MVTASVWPVGASFSFKLRFFNHTVCLELSFSPFFETLTLSCLNFYSACWPCFQVIPMGATSFFLSFGHPRCDPSPFSLAVRRCPLVFFSFGFAFGPFLSCSLKLFNGPPLKSHFTVFPPPSMECHTSLSRYCRVLASTLNNHPPLWDAFLPRLATPSPLLSILYGLLPTEVSSFPPPLLWIDSPFSFSYILSFPFVGPHLGPFALPPLWFFFRIFFFLFLQIAFFPRLCRAFPENFLPICPPAVKCLFSSPFASIDPLTLFAVWCWVCLLCRFLNTF